MLLSKHLSSVVMKVDHKLLLVYVDSNVFFCVWIFSGEDIGSYFHICGFTSNSTSLY